MWDIYDVHSKRVLEKQTREKFARTGNPKDKAHFGCIFDICVEKNSELPDGDPNKKFKGRVVFEGCHVKDEANNWAIFSEIASCPATMQAAKAADAYGLVDGHGVQCADGESAYTQAKFIGTPTWITIRDRDRWPDFWFHDGAKRQKPKFEDPCCRLKKALYGHPDSGGYWEQHCEKQLTRDDVGFVAVHETWKSVFWHPRLSLMLVVYVDDFKLSGPKKNLAEGWTLIGRGITMGSSGPVGRYLGCHHDEASSTAPPNFNPRCGWSAEHPPKKPEPDCFFGKTKFPEHDAALKQGGEEDLKTDSTVEALLSAVPAADANSAIVGNRFPGLQPNSTGRNQGGVPPVHFMKYNMQDFMKSCVDRYIELGGNRIKEKLKVVDTPFLDESKPEFDENPIKGDNGEVIETKPGVLGDIACAVLMKVLYGARMARYDLIRAVGALASRITKWTYLCDRKLHRLMCYINSTTDLSMYAWIGDAIENLELVLFCDADLAGDRTDSKSTTGVFLCILGPRSFVPLTGISKKQTSISRSTPEAEIVALAHGLFKEAIPAIELWSRVLGKKIRIRVLEDNEAACRVIITGKNPSMRHMSRTQRIDISSINDVYSKGEFMFVNCPTEYQAADIFTKYIIDKIVWNRNLMLIGHFRPGYLKSLGATNACPVIKLDLSLVESNDGSFHCAVADLPDASELNDKFINAVRNTNVLPEHQCLISSNGPVDRTLVEFCCGPNSRLGRSYECSKGCRVIRITEELNANSVQGKFLSAKGMCSRRGLLFGSIPCTGGCPFNSINERTEQGKANIRRHIANMLPLLRTFEKLCALADRCDNFICLEWPAGCAYWKRKDVQRLIETYNLTVVKFNGCRLKLTDSSGNLLAKPWKLATNCPGIIKRFTGLKCLRDHEHGENNGKTLKETENYTYDFVRLIHEGFSASL